MNFLLVGVLVAMSNSGNIPHVNCQPLTRDEIERNTRELIVSCKEETGASFADMEALNNHKLPESHEGICMVECIFEKMQILNNGTFSRDGMIKTFSNFVGGDEEKLKNVENVATVCEERIGKGGNDKCEIAKLLVDCLIEHEIKHDVKISSKLSRQKVVD